MNTLGLQLVDDYFRWLRSHTQVRDVEGWTESTVPFLDRHNDHLQLYVQPHNGDYVLTDDGYTVADLEILMGGPVSLSSCTPEEFAKESQVMGMRAYRALTHPLN